MFTCVRTYQGDASQIDEMLSIIDEKFLPQLADMPGMCSYQVVDCGGGEIMTISCFTTQEGAERSTEMAGEFVRDQLSEYTLERTNVTEGAARISVAQQGVLEPSHA